MKVAFLTNSETLYGSNRSLLDLIDGLRHFPVEPHVILPKAGDMAAALASRHVPMAILPIQNWVTGRKGTAGLPLQDASRYARERREALFRLARNLKHMSKLSQQLRLWNIDIVHTNSSVTPAGAMAAALLHRPHIWHLREFVDDMDCDLSTDWGMKLCRYFISRSDAQIAISKAIRAYYFGDRDTGHTDVIYDGIATLRQFDEWQMLATQETSKDVAKPYTFLIVGRITPSKGQSTAVEAIARLATTHPDVRLVVVGGGRQDPLKELASELGVAGKVEFRGYTDNPYQAYFSTDAVLVCSKSEGMGRVAVEAMSSCRPVIGLDRTATPEIIEHGHTGLLFSDGAEELAGCMRQFVENPIWARALGTNGWGVARKRHNSELHAQRVYDVLDRVRYAQ